MNDYEAGRAIPNQQIMSKLERTLGSCVVVMASDSLIISRTLNFRCEVARQGHWPASCSQGWEEVRSALVQEIGVRALSSLVTSC